MKSASATTLKITMIVLVRALCLTPASSTPVTASTMNIAGRLTTPPSSRGAEIAAGNVTPKTRSRNVLKYPPQPTATAATVTEYSSSRSQPMIQATSSPIVA